MSKENKEGIYLYIMFLFSLIGLGVVLDLIINFLTKIQW